MNIHSQTKAVAEKCSGDKARTGESTVAAMEMEIMSWAVGGPEQRLCLVEGGMPKDIARGLLPFTVKSVSKWTCLIVYVAFGGVTQLLLWPHHANCGSD
jgi:hypothetical protein